MSQDPALLPDWGGQLGPRAHPEAATAPGLAHSCAPASGPGRQPAFVSSAREELNRFAEFFLPVTHPLRESWFRGQNSAYSRAVLGQPRRRDTGGHLCTRTEAWLYWVPFQDSRAVSKAPEFST